MSECKHTLGPLTVHHGDGVSYIAARTKIANVYSTAFKDREEQEANANLLGASLELLDALKMALNYLDRPDNNALSYAIRPGDVARFRKAIARAEGDL